MNDTRQQPPYADNSQNAVLRRFMQRAKIQLSADQKKAILREIKRLYGDTFLEDADCEKMMCKMGFVRPDGTRPLPKRKTLERMGQKIRPGLFHLGYLEENAESIASWLWAHRIISDPGQSIKQHKIMDAADALGIVNLKRDRPEEWARIQQEREQKKAAVRARAEERRLVREQQEKEKAAALKAIAIAQRKQHAEHLMRDLPASNPKRLLFLVRLLAEDRKALRQSGAITKEEETGAAQVKKSAMLISSAAAFLGVRKEEIDRWDLDWRLPHAWEDVIKIQGRATTVRKWIVPDLEKARKKLVAWLLQDVKAGKIRPIAHNMQMLERLQVPLPEAFLSKGRQAQAIQETKAQAERLRQQQEEAQKQAQRQRAMSEKMNHEKSIRNATAAGSALSIADYFDNPLWGDREIQAILGPTNSGKTWQALQALKTCTPHYRGVYLAPLRLLAVEVCDELRAAGMRVSLLTGEEQDLVENPQVICSTIEMLDMTQDYRVAVIDEMQMLADPNRGWAWTQAFLGVRADEVYAIGSPGCRAALHRLAHLTGDPLTEQFTERFTPLKTSAKPIPPDRIRKGTIFVVFSRNSVIRWGEHFRNNGMRIAQIYGASPPEVRREEARRFREGEADILVATDAIAMGLNLPAHTVVLGESQKYDGKSMGKVPLPLVRQIAGRAGRYGHHDAGTAAGMDYTTQSLVQQALSTTDNPDADHPLYLNPPAAWIATVQKVYPGIRTRDLLLAWVRTLSQSAVFTVPRLAESLQKAQFLDSHQDLLNVAIDERLRWVSAPLNIQEGQMATYYRVFLRAIVHSDVAAPVPSVRDGMRTDEWESAYKLLSLYCWFHFRYPDVFLEIDLAIARRNECVDRIIGQIRKGLRRYCRECGTVLPQYHSYAICDQCYR